jgi:hypothetical protein
MSSDTSEDQGLEQWKAVADAQLKLIEVVAAYRKANAEAELLEAQARYEDEKTEELAVLVRAKRDAIQQMELEFWQLNKERHVAKYQQGLINRRVGQASLLYRGQALPADWLSDAWEGWLWLLQHANAAISKASREARITDAERAKEDFFSPRKKAEAVEDVPQSVGNPLQLLEWCREQRLVPRTGSKAYEHMELLLEAASAPAIAQLEKIEIAFQAMRGKTYNAWQPLELLKLRPS